MSMSKKALIAVALLAMGGTAAAGSSGSFDDGRRGGDQFSHGFGGYDRHDRGSFDDGRWGGHDRRDRNDHRSGKWWSRDRDWGHGGHDGPDVTSPVPEPSTYALMLAGLGAVAFMARRRRQR